MSFRNNNSHNIVSRLHADAEYKISLSNKENDARSASMIRKAFLKEHCRRWLAGNEYHPSLFPRDSPRQFNISLKESVCKTNKTLALIAIDSLRYFHFAEHLGIDISKWRNKTAVVILDATVSFEMIKRYFDNCYILIP